MKAFGRAHTASLALALVAVMATAPAGAQPRRSADPLRFLIWPVGDARALAGNLVSSQSLYALGAGAALVWASRYDETLTDKASDLADTPVLRVVEEFGNVKAVQPMAVVLFVGSLMSGDARFQDAAFTSLEAVVFANLITNGLKGAFGRARPRQNHGSGAFRPFSGDTSFPSGHATTVFALVTPWLFYYPHWTTAGLVVLAAGTAFSRMATRAHWFTDVVAGAAVGFLTGYGLSRRHLRTGGLRIAPQLGYRSAGVRVRF